MNAGPVSRRRRRLGTLTIATLIVGSGGLGGWFGWSSADTGGSASSRTVVTEPTIPGGSGQSGSESATDPAGPNVDAISARVSPAVVNINTVLRDGGQGAATGMVITSSGEVLTNNHVVAGTVSISVELQDGSRHGATVIGSDVVEDVAVIMVTGVSGLPTITAVGTPTPSVGDTVIAIGNAHGRGGAPTASAGSIVAVDQTVTAAESDGSGAKQLNGLIRVDADIQPGDSGGPLVDTAAAVVGMDTAALTRPLSGVSGGSTTEAYAIPIDHALSVAKRLEGANSGSATATPITAAASARARVHAPASISLRRPIVTARPVEWRTPW